MIGTANNTWQVGSRPSRARGSKLDQSAKRSERRIVAPLTGAWIETVSRACQSASSPRSRPSRARGSKPSILQTWPAGWGRAPHGRVDRNNPLSVYPDPSALVAPLTGAWIETMLPRTSDALLLVAPLTGAWIETFMRGWRPKLPHPSRPSRARGSKLPTPLGCPMRSRVAPLTGAWIETTTCGRRGLVAATSRPSRARGSKRQRSRVGCEGSGRAPHGRVDRNDAELQRLAKQYRRAPHGRVDRNFEHVGFQPVDGVAPLTGAWIETACRSGRAHRCRASRPSRARGSKQRIGINTWTVCGVAPLTGAWIETAR